jgi:hypothetical protein
MTESVIKTYDSIGAFCAALDAEAPADKKAKRGNDWYGNQSWEQARKSVIEGYLDVVPKANTLIEKLAGASIELDQAQWELSMAGAFPCVPAYLADAPEAMFRQVQVKTETAPVRIFASVCCSAGVDAETLEARGVTILALCMKLTSIRPVELYVYADMGGRSGGKGHAIMPCVKVETSPLDLSTATYALSHAAFLRQLCFSWAYPKGWDGAWAWGSSPTDADSIRQTSEALGVGEHDLLIPGGYLNDPLITRPVEWINEQIARFTNAQEEL